MVKNLLGNDRAFTVVELIIVIVVVSVLTILTLTFFPAFKDEAVVAAIKTDLTNASKEIKLYKMNNNFYPESISDCPTPSNDNLCINSSNGVTFSYIYNSFTHKTFVLTATWEDVTYTVSNTSPVSAIGQNLLTGDTSAEITTSSANEYMQYLDLAPIFNNYGLHEYTISFDVKSSDISNNNTMLVYMQNGSDQRYGGLSSYEPVTTSYRRASVIFTPTLVDESIEKSMLAFYGTYGTGNIPTVKNVKVELGNTATEWTQAP